MLTGINIYIPNYREIFLSSLTIRTRNKLPKPNYIFRFQKSTNTKLLVTKASKGHKNDIELFLLYVLNFFSIYWIIYNIYKNIYNIYSII